MPNYLFLMPSGELIIMDELDAFKNKQLLDSPFWRARMDFWEQTDLFEPLDLEHGYTPAQRLMYSLTYWKHPPTLELPERAQSLSDWSHCHWCGYPLHAPTLFPCPGYWEDR